MQPTEVLSHVTTPLVNPAFAPVVPRFTDREYLNIVYRTDPDALRAVVPEPLTIDEPLVRFEVMRMGDVSGYGPYTESGQAIPVTFDGEREVSAYPKTIGAPRLYVDNGALVGTLDYGTLRVATATMGYKHHQLDLDAAKAQITVPTFMLKITPGYDGIPRIAELVRTEITDVIVKEAWTGPARLQLFEHVLAPLADLPVREVVSASHILTDLTLAPVTPVHDYLNGARS